MLRKKVTEWAEDKGKEIKENEFEIEDMKTFQAKLILKSSVKFVLLKGLDCKTIENSRGREWGQRTN